MSELPEKHGWRKDPFDGPYVGNIWGWRFSIFGLVLILLLLALMLYRHWSMGVSFGGEAPAGEERTELPVE